MCSRRSICHWCGGKGNFEREHSTMNKTLRPWIWSLGISFAILLVLLLAQPARQGDAKNRLTGVPISASVAADEGLPAESSHSRSRLASSQSNPTLEDADGMFADNKLTSQSVISFTASAYQGREDTGTITVTVQRTGSTSSTVSVDYTVVSGTATLEEDYAAISGTLTFTNGESSRTLPISIVNDTQVEENESFWLQLRKPTDGAILGTPDTTEVIIEDDEPGILSFATNTHIVTESAGSITVTVQRTGGLKGVVSIDIVSSGMHGFRKVLRQQKGGLDKKPPTYNIMRL
jgi:hypothetical protein